MKIVLGVLVSIFLASFNQGPLTVIKKNGNVISLKDYQVVQNSSTASSSQIVFYQGGKQKSVVFKHIKRLNLKGIVSRKKGVETWNALLIMKNGSKIEIKIDLDEIRGTNVGGNTVSISSSTIDKISF